MNASHGSLRQAPLKRLLPAQAFPSPSTASISADRIHDPQADIAAFGADRWPMLALDLPGHRRHRALKFTAWPPAFRSFAKHLAHALINFGNPPALLDKGAGSYVRWPSPASVRRLLDDVKTSVIWLTADWSSAHPDTPVTCPADLDSEHLDDVRWWINASVGNDTTRRGKLQALVRVWHLNPWLPLDLQFPEPVWRHEHWQPPRRTGENSTRRLE